MKLMAGLLRFKYPDSSEWEDLGRITNRAATSPDHFDLVFSNIEDRLFLVDREVKSFPHHI